MSRTIAYRNLPLLLLKAREALLSHFRPILAHFGVTEQQWRVIRALSEEGSLEPRQICQVCQILSPSLAGVLARMEEVGLVERERVPEDQRRMIVRLTDRSRQMVEDAAPLVEAQYRALETAVGKALLDEVYQTLDLFIREESLADIEHVALPEPSTTKRAQKDRRKSEAEARATDPDRDR